jgi:threonine dehydrogenase-like Zn-dependent dehydrogenase
MKAVVWQGVGKIELTDVADPRIVQPTDAIVAITESAICGTDLHMIRGTMTGMRPGTILGHEGVGIVEEVGPAVRNFKRGDRVVIPSTICCGYCSYCRAGYFAQCDNANPNGPQAGTAFFGGPETTGPIDGLQAERARIPFANTTLVPVPESVTDKQAIMVSDIFPTGWFGAKLAEVRPGDTVAVFGCGPVGQFAIASALLMRAGRVIAVDHEPTRLEMARAQHAEVIDFDREEPVQVIHELTGGVGVDRVIDAVGVDAQHPSGGDGSQAFAQEVEEVAPEHVTSGNDWVPGDAPSQATQWAVKAVAKAGTLGIIGVYPETMTRFPIGAAMMRNLSINMGNCNHRKYIPDLLEFIATGRIDPTKVLTQSVPLSGVIDAYHHFDRRESGWVKVALDVGYVKAA